MWYDWDDIKMCVACEIQHDVSELYEGNGEPICFPCLIEEVKLRNKAKDCTETKEYSS